MANRLYEDPTFVAQIKATEVRSIRMQIIDTSCCAPENHVWGRLTFDSFTRISGHLEPFTIIVLCRLCGRTPLESLQQLEIWP